MNSLRENFWIGVLVLVVIGLCVGLGIIAQSAWVSALAIAGFVIAYWGAAEGMNDNPGRFVIYSIAGVSLMAGAVWLGRSGGLPASGWRWLWTPVWLIVCIAPFVGGTELRKNDHNFAGAVGIFLGILCLVASIVVPLILPSLQSQNLPASGKPINLSNIWWVLGLALGLICAWMAYQQGDALNPGRFSLFALAAVALLGWATYASQTPGRWVWVIPWLVVAGLIYAGAKEVKLYRDWAGYLGYLLTLLCVAGAALAVLWYYNRVAIPKPAAEAPVAAPAVTQAPTLAPTTVLTPTEIVQPTAAAGAKTGQPTREIGFVWTFMVAAFTSVWGIFHLLVIALLGEIWIRRWGAPVFLAILLAAAWYFGSTSPEAQAAWMNWISASPASWMRSILGYSIDNFGTLGIGILLAGLGLAVLLFPAARLMFRGNQTIQEVGALNKLLGSTAALRYMNLKGVSQGRLALAAILNAGLVVGAAISLWSALQNIAKTGAYPVSELGFLFIPNLTVPSFKPVWQWPYFAMAGILWLAFVVSNLIQRRYIKVLPYAGCQNPLVSLVLFMVSAMVTPAGVLLFSTVQLVCQWVTVPLSFVGGKVEAKPKPKPQPPVIVKPVSPPSEEIIHSQPVESAPPITTPPITIPPMVLEPELIGEEIFTSTEPMVAFAINDQGQCLALFKTGSLGLVANGELKAKMKIDLTGPVGLACAARGELAAIGRNGKLLALKPAETGFEIVREGALSIPVRSYALNPFGTLLACCHPDMSKVCGVFLGKMEEKVFSDQIENPTALGFSPDGRYLAIGSEAGSVHIIDIATRQQTQTLDVVDTDLEGPISQVAGFKKHGQPCWLVTYENEQAALWAVDGELLDKTELSFTANCLAVDLERERFAVGGPNGEVEVYSADLLLELDGQAHEGKLIQLAFDKSSGQLFSTGSDNIVKEIQV